MCQAPAAGGHELAAATAECSMTTSQRTQSLQPFSTCMRCCCTLQQLRPRSAWAQLSGGCTHGSLGQQTSCTATWMSAQFQLHRPVSGHMLTAAQPERERSADQASCLETQRPCCMLHTAATMSPAVLLCRHSAASCICQQARLRGRQSLWTHQSVQALGQSRTRVQLASQGDGAWGRRRTATWRPAARRPSSCT